MAKPGRKSKLETLDETTPGGVESETRIKTRNYRGKRDTSYGIMDKIRDDIDPELIKQYWVMILRGFVPVWIPDARSKYGYRVEPDPNHMNNVSTPAQRDAAIRELTLRGWGQAPQSFQIEAHIKATLEQGIPQDLLAQANYALLAEFRDSINRHTLKLEDGNTEDAEIISESSAEETIQPIANSVPEPESSVVLNANSPPEDDSSGQ